MGSGGGSRLSEDIGILAKVDFEGPDGLSARTLR
jgi:hypothetical protein